MTVADGLGIAGADFSFAMPAVDDIARLGRRERRCGMDEPTLGGLLLTTGLRR